MGLIEFIIAYKVHNKEYATKQEAPPRDKNGSLKDNRRTKGVPLSAVLRDNFNGEANSTHKINSGMLVCAAISVEDRPVSRAKNLQQLAA